MIFDANVRLGRLALSRGPSFDTAEDLLAAMDTFGIARALVYTALARESDCVRGNTLLQEKINGHSRLIPCWVAIPNRESPARLVGRMEAQRIPALRLFPSTGHFSIRPWCIGALARELSAARKVLLLDFEGPSWSTDRTDWEGIYQLCRDFPELRVVVCGVTMAGPANYQGFIRECANLHLEISQFVCPGEVKRLVEDGLANRLIFGSDFPTRHPGAPLALVALENVDAASKQLILNNNLADLLSPLEPVGDLPTPIPIRQIQTIIDTHVHLGGWNNSFAGTGLVEDTVRDMDRCGISSIVATSLWSCFGEVSLGNEDVARACEKFPERVYGYLTLDPKRQVEVEQQIKRFGENVGFRGVKLHGQTHGVDIADPRCSDILSFADSRGLPVLVHQVKIDPVPWEEICGKYPRASFIVAHVGGCGPDDAAALALAGLAAQVENLYFDIASTRNFFGFLEDLIDLAGAKKILYGSDHPLMDFGFELGQVLFSGISRDDQTLILSENARRIFRLP